MNEQIRSLIRAYANGVVTSNQLEELEQMLREESTVREQFLQELNIHAALDDVAFGEGGGDGAEILDPLNGPDALLAERCTTIRERLPRIRLLRRLLALSAMVIVTLSASLLYQRSSADRRIAEIEKINRHPATELPIARITGLSGTLIWTGDRGQIVRDVKIGNELAGGTIEGMAPDSWFELRFNDGSTVMISGTSVLTFSEFGQKELHLKRGSLSASVVPQPDGKPMLIHTRSVVLKVLGTQFKVGTELDSTSLHVSEGRVQVKRLSDGRTIEVPANHRIVTSSDGEMSATLIPEIVYDWKSHLDRGPSDLNGKWLPPNGEKPASLKAIPFVPQGNQSIMLHLAGLCVKRTDNAPVVVKPDSRFIVRGQMQVSAKLLFGIQVARQNGEFAGKFLAHQLVNIEGENSDFEAEFHLDGFGLDPIVWHRKAELPSKPDDLALTSVWAFTHTGRPTGLEITEIELVPPVSQ